MERDKKRLSRENSDTIRWTAWLKMQFDRIKLLVFAGQELAHEDAERHCDDPHSTATGPRRDVLSKISKCCSNGSNSPLVSNQQDCDAACYWLECVALFGASEWRTTSLMGVQQYHNEGSSRLT